MFNPILAYLQGWRYHDLDKGWEVCVIRCLATFDVTSMAIMFERLFRKKGLNVKVVPVPRSLSSSCGLACEYPCEDEEEIRSICVDRDIDVIGWHRLD